MPIDVGGDHRSLVRKSFAKVDHFVETPHSDVGACGLRDVHKLDAQPLTAFEDRAPAIENDTDLVKTRATGMNAGDLCLVIPDLGHCGEIPALECVVERSLCDFR